MANTLHISDIQLYNLLKIKLCEQEAEQLVKFVRTEVENSVDAKYEFLNKDMAAINYNLNIDIKSLKEELYMSFATKTDLAKTESKLILWAFVFWATQLGAIFAFLKVFVK